jgi:hypothetical protein
MLMLKGTNEIEKIVTEEERYAPVSVEVRVWELRDLQIQGYNMFRVEIRNPGQSSMLTAAP